jgi:D-amino-acid dehydrogenase
MRESTDVIVIGGGIIGCWTAWHLAHRGCAVTIVERDRLGGGASSGNCGYICPSHVRPLSGPGAVVNGLRLIAKRGGALSIPPRFDPALWKWLVRFAKHANARDCQNASVARHALLQSSRKQYQDFAAKNASPIQWHENGLLMVYRSERDFHAYQRVASQLRSEFGLRVNCLEGDQLCDLEPGLRSGLAGGWYFPDDAHLSPTALLTQLRREIEQLGGVILERTEVNGFEFDGERIASVQTAGAGRLKAGACILTTGAEAAGLGKELGCRIPVVPGKGYSITFANSSGMPKTPMIFEDDHVAVTPLGDSFRIGSTMQLTGFDRSISPKRIELLKRSARQHLRNPLPHAVETAWSGWRPMMPDGLPCIDRTPRCVNAYIAAGNGMIGMATGPATGQLVAELALNLSPHLDPHPYRVRRFDSLL